MQMQRTCHEDTSRARYIQCKASENLPKFLDMATFLVLYDRVPCRSVNLATAAQCQSVISCAKLRTRCWTRGVRQRLFYIYRVMGALQCQLRSSKRRELSFGTVLATRLRSHVARSSLFYAKQRRQRLAMDGDGRGCGWIC